MDDELHVLAGPGCEISNQFLNGLINLVNYFNKQTTEMSSLSEDSGQS